MPLALAASLRVCSRLPRRTGSATAAQHTVSCASCSVYEKKVRYLVNHQPVSHVRGVHKPQQQSAPGSHLKKKPKPVAPGRFLASGDKKCQNHTNECQASRAKCTVDATYRRICAYCYRIKTTLPSSTWTALAPLLDWEHPWVFGWVSFINIGIASRETTSTEHGGYRT